jgi:hypothetical protein
MADGKFFTKETKDLIVNVVDDAVKLGVIGELVDGLAARGLVNIVDHYGDKYVPDEYDATINEVATLALNGEYELAGGKAGELINDLVDIPMLDDSIEKLVFVDGLKFVVRLLQDYIEKKREQ